MGGEGSILGENGLKIVNISSRWKYQKDVYSTVPELRSRYSKLERYTKLRRQVKQARLPKWPLHWMGLHIYYNGFT